MDRFIPYLGELIDNKDFLAMGRYGLIGLGKLAQALLGEQPCVRGLACTPTQPASLQVQVSAGEIYALANLDNTPFGDLPADTQHTLVKQGLFMDSQLFDCPAPVTEGHSVIHLIQASFAEVDDARDLLPYYNASDPQHVWWGPDNDGKTQPTARRGVCQVVLKPGISAPTGRQQPPAVDAGYIGLYAITVAHGQTTITEAQLQRVAPAPFLDETLPQKISQRFADQRYLTPAQGDGRYVRREDAVAIPAGGIMMWHGAVKAIPSGWVLCDGQQGTPDLRDRFVVGAGGQYAVADTGGAATITLTTHQMPFHAHAAQTEGQGHHRHSGRTDGQGEHDHPLRGWVGGKNDAGGVIGDLNVGTAISDRTQVAGQHAHHFLTDEAGAHTHPVTVEGAGGGQAHENRPPYYALCFIMRL